VRLGIGAAPEPFFAGSLGLRAGCRVDRALLHEEDMSVSTEHAEPQDDIITARNLPVHVELESEDDGGHVLKGWVSCPLKGHLDVETCSVCTYSQGVRLTARGHAPEVLCGWVEPELSC
jgi:hypothetical protein